MRYNPNQVDPGKSVEVYDDNTVNGKAIDITWLFKLFGALFGLVNTLGGILSFLLYTAFGLFVLWVLGLVLYALLGMGACLTGYVPGCF